jgi:hypothetical protein
MVSALPAANCRPRGEPPACTSTGWPWGGRATFNGPRERNQRPSKSTVCTLAGSTYTPAGSATTASASHDPHSRFTTSTISSAMS